MTTLVTPEPQEISLIQLATRHWKLGVLSVCVCIGLAALATALMPHLYEAEMKFLVNNERADLVITPEKNSNAQAPQEVTETQVNSEIELLKSRDLLEAIVKTNRLDLPSGKASFAAQPDGPAVAKAVRKLSKDLNISALRKSNIIQVTYRANGPDRSKAILRDLGSRYLNAHLAAHSSPGTYSFFTEQVNHYRQQLLQTRLDLSNFHRVHSLYSLGVQQDATLSALQSADTRLKEIEAEVATEHARLNEAESQLASSPERITTQVRALPNQQSTQQLQTLLTEQRNRRIDLAVKLKPTDRLITDLDAQIANTERDLAAATASRSEETTTDLDSVRQSVKAEFVRGRVALTGLQQQREEYARLRNGYFAKLNNMETDSLALLKLEQARKEARIGTSQVTMARCSNPVTNIERDQDNQCRDAEMYPTLLSGVTIATLVTQLLLCR